MARFSRISWILLLVTALLLVACEELVTPSPEATSEEESELRGGPAGAGAREGHRKRRGNPGPYPGSRGHCEAR